MSRDEWYRARDDRTRRVDNCTGFEKFKVGVVIGSEVQSEFSVQVISLITLNILARWCRNVTIQMPAAVVSQLPPAGDLRENLARMMRQIDPFGNFAFQEIQENQNDVIMALGFQTDIYGEDTVYIGGAGWIGGFSIGDHQILHKSGNESKNVIGPTFASCLGAAEVFRRAVGLGKSQPFSVWYSLFDFSWGDDAQKLANPPVNSKIELGRIYQIGCGAVGSSLDLLMSLTNWGAEIELIDYDRIEPSNCNRSLSFQASDCISNAYKADACACVLNNGRFQPRAFRNNYAQFVEQGNYLKIPPDAVLCLANEQNVWATVQNNFPPLVLHATTTTNWGTNLGRHLPKTDWCLMCRFGEELNHEFIPICGEGQLLRESNASPPVEGVLPFLPTAASVVLLSELGKLSLSNYPVNRNFVTFSFRQPEGRFLQLQNKPKQNCMCREQMLDLYPSQVRASKYWTIEQTKNLRALHS